MAGVKLEPDKQVEFRIRNYEFLVGRYLDFYRLYMQSWSIIGSGILLSGIVAITSDATEARLGLVSCILPPVLLVWFLLTSYFWATFTLYRHAIADLEAGMLRDWADHPGLSPEFYSGRVLALFPSGWARRGSKKCVPTLLPILVVAFTAPVYGLFSHGAAEHLQRALGFDYWGGLLIYLAGAGATILVIILFLRRAAGVATRSP